MRVFVPAYAYDQVNIGEHLLALLEQSSVTEVKEVEDAVSVETSGTTGILA
jgi:hypothetical protein